MLTLASSGILAVNSFKLKGSCNAFGTMLGLMEVKCEISFHFLIQFIEDLTGWEKAAVWMLIMF